jgi:hypothetical protein
MFWGIYLVLTLPVPILMILLLSIAPRMIEDKVCIYCVAWAPWSHVHLRYACDVCRHLD